MTSNQASDKIDVGISQLIEEKLYSYFSSLNGDKPCADLYNCILQEVEKPLLAMALKVCEGNKVKAASLLGINRNTLTKKLKDYKIIF